MLGLWRHNQEPHYHYCSVCYSNWIHDDESCQAGPDYECPIHGYGDRIGWE